MRGSIDWRQLAGLGINARSAYIREALEAHGFQKPQRIAETIARLLSLPIFTIAAARVLKIIERAGSPERAVLALEDAIDALEASRGDASPLFIDPVLRLFVELAGASGRAARMLSRDPQLAIELAARNVEPNHPRAMEKIVHAAAGDTESFDRLLRRYRNRQMLRIALFELREGDVRESSKELAELASAASQAALDHHLPLLTAQLGRPDPPCTHLIVGMGKLGGRELNFSSDIDVLYFYAHDDGRAGEVSLHQFFIKLFERATQSLARITEQGFVFRVDLDLRPEGRSGALANSLASAERYYETWGRTWERAAWIKARPIAGSMELGEKILAALRPFVWRKSFDLKAIEEIFDMKTKIDDARSRAARMHKAQGVDLKLGKGGIREIEFFVQAYQLLHGGRDARLRAENTLEALSRLEAAGHVSSKLREELADAYLFLRRFEHRVQIVEEQKTHSVPVDPAAAAAIARSLSFGSVEEMHRALAETMRGVHETFTHLIGAAKEEDHTAPDIDVLLARDASEDEKLAAFSALGARDPHSALANLDRAAHHSQSPFHPHASDAAKAIARRLLAECCASPSLDRAMKHLPELARSLLTHASYLEELARPTLRRGIARVLGASDLLARILVSSPALLPQVLLAETLPPAEALDREIATRLEGVEDVEVAMQILRAVKQEETLRTAIADLGGAIETVQVNERLTRLAEKLIAHALRFAEAEMIARYGAASGSSMVVVAGGTLGAHEMGYRSDVDLSFIFDGEGETAGGERGAISNGELYTRVAQRLLSFLTLRLPQGDLYPADMRLRPSGSHGALVVSLAGFERYHAKEAQLWERQALVRARVIAGPLELRERVEAAIAHAAYDAPAPPDAKARIHEMRTRMEKERSAPRRRRFRAAGEEERAQEVVDLKLGSGGIVEAEFLVQYLLIAQGARHPAIRTTSTRRALAALAGAKLLEKPTAERVIRAYDRLKTLQNWLRIAHDEMLDHVDLSDETLRPLALATGYAGDSAEKLLRRDLLADTDAIHLCYDEVLGRG